MPYGNTYFNPYLQSAYGQMQGYQMPQYQSPYPQATAQQIQAQQPAPQSMTPPTIHAEIIQVKGVEDVERFPVNAGTSQLFQMSDDSAFLIKSTYPNGQSDIDIYTKQPKKPPAPALDPSQFVTWDKLEERLANLSPVKRVRAKKEEVVEDGESIQ